MGMDWGIHNEQPDVGLLYLVGGFTVFNSILLATEKIFSNKICPVPIETKIVLNKTPTKNPIKDIVKLRGPHPPTSMPLTFISGLFFANFCSKLEQTTNNWYVRNDTSLSWNDWVRLNPEKARDICIEADYFFGNSNVLPGDWSNIIEKWEDMSRGDARIDDGSYQPLICDEPETGPVRS